MNDTGRIKGTLLVSRMKYLRVQGQRVVRSVLDRLPAEDREVLDGLLLLPSGWYPVELLRRLDAAITASLADGTRSAMLLDLGQFSADLNLGPGGVLRPYLREDEPHGLLREIPGSTPPSTARAAARTSGSALALPSFVPSAAMAPKGRTA